MEDKKIKAWENYAKKFNSLSKKMIAAGLDPNELSDVINSKIEYQKLIEDKM